MIRRWAGPLVAILTIGGVVLIVVLNLNPAPARQPSTGKPKAPAPEASAALAAGFREYPIGDDPVLKNHMLIRAVWLPPIAMEGMPAMPAGGDVIHLEADIHATEGNPNGFANHEFVPYLKIHFTITPDGSGSPPIHKGDLIPMVASDGLHYGAQVAMPQAGSYRLNYSIEPPSAGGLGRHSDAATGVAPWWQPFEVSFDWDYPGPPR